MVFNDRSLLNLRVAPLLYPVLVSMVFNDRSLLNTQPPAKPAQTVGFQWSSMTGVSSTPSRRRVAPLPTFQWSSMTGVSSTSPRKFAARGCVVSMVFNDRSLLNDCESYYAAAKYVSMVFNDRSLLNRDRACFVRFLGFQWSSMTGVSSTMVLLE